MKTSLESFVNEVIQGEDGCRTICGEIAHAFAKVTPSTALIGQPFQVWERVKGGAFVLRAAQSTKEGATRYFKPGFVLVTLPPAKLVTIDRICYTRSEALTHSAGHCPAADHGLHTVLFGTRHCCKCGAR